MQAADLDRFAAELDLIEKSYVQYLGLTQALRLSQPKFMEQFRRMLMSKLRVVFENASAELEMWNKSASAQVDAQLRERAALPPPARIAGAHPGRGQRAGTRLEELDAQDQRLQEQRHGRCIELIDALRQRARHRHARHRVSSTITIDRPAAGRFADAAAAAPCQSLSPPSLSARLIDWQRRHGRHAALAAHARPYRVLAPEIMLQQTQVATVLGYYERFLQRFPDVRGARRGRCRRGAGAVERTGLLQPRAQPAPLRRRWWPNTAASSAASTQLATLPGIGRSTAAAIAAFCFGERVAILDGNVKRVLTRVLGFDGDLAGPRRSAGCGRHATDLLPHEHIEAYTQGLMDLGATLAWRARRAARSARCARAAWRAARVGPSVSGEDRKLERKARENVWLWLALAGSPLAGATARESGVWAGLWSLPEFDSTEALGAASQGWPGTGEALPGFSMH